MSRKTIKCTHQSSNHFFSLILHLPVYSLHDLQGKTMSFIVNFFKLSFGDEFDCNGTMWIHLNLFHVLETRNSIQRSQDDVLERVLSEIQYGLNSVYMTLVWSFNPQVQALLIHLSHELHDTNKFLKKKTSSCNNYR